MTEMIKGKKYIHYCWFGSKRIPWKARKCIRSWKRYLPDYEIVRWDETNVDLNECPFVREAYQRKKWAFVADYVRTKALYEYGGVYLDTDVMIKKKVDFLLDKPAFVGVEDSGYVNVAVWGAKKEKSFLARDVLDFYRGQAHFNHLDLYSITIPVIVTNILSKHGFKKDAEGLQVIKDTYVYPRDYFYPLSYDYENNRFTDNTCMVHYSDASWASSKEKRDIKLIRIFGRRKAGILLKIVSKFKALFVYYGKVLWRTMLLILSPIRLLVKWLRRKTQGGDFGRIAKRISECREKYIVFTHEGWIGVESSTRELLGDVIEVGDFAMADDFAEVIQAIKNNNRIRMVIFSAFGTGWEYLARKIKSECPGLVVKVFWHGSNAMHIEKYDWNRFDTIFMLLEQNVVDSIAFAKKSMYEQYSALGYNVEFLPNSVNINNKEKFLKQKAHHDGLRVGIYASGDRWVKNMYNQMAAVSLLDDVVLDMIPLSQTALQFAKLLKLNVTGEGESIKREEMFKRVVSDDVVLYTTFVECAPVLPLECLELGVLCVTVNNHHYWEGTPLEEYLVEPKADNPVAISKRVEKCLENREKILSLYVEWKKEYDKYCKRELRKFLDSK